MGQCANVVIVIGADSLMRDSPKSRLVALITFDSQDGWDDADVRVLPPGMAAAAAQLLFSRRVTIGVNVIVYTAGIDTVKFADESA